jgi:hypothetical protein
MSLVLTKNISINTAAVSPISDGDGVSGFQYGQSAYLYYLKELLVALGSTVTVSSTRTSGTGTAANAVANSDQWTNVYKPMYGSSYVGITLPAVRGITRRLCIQVDSTGPGSNFNARVKIAWGGDYNIAGGGTATKVPTVSGEQVVLGGGTDASPTFAAWGPNSGSYIFQGLGYNDSPMGFAALLYPPAGSATGGSGWFFAMDPLEDASYQSGCDDVVLVSYAQATPDAGSLTAESVCYARARLGLSGAAWSAIKMLAVGSIPGSAASEPRTNKKPSARIRYARDTSPADSFGLSRLFRWFGPASSVPRTGTLLTTKDKLIIGPLCLPWDGTEPA